MTPLNRLQRSLTDPRQLTIIADWLSDLPWSEAPDVAAEVVRHVQRLLEAEIGVAGAGALLSSIVMEIDHVPARQALQNFLIALGAPATIDLNGDDRYEVGTAPRGRTIG